MPSDFTPPSEELQRLAEEISLLRRDFQTGFAALSRIEKRLKSAFPGYTPKKQFRSQSAGGPHAGSTKTADQLNADFDSLLVVTKERGDVGFESAISALPDADVVALAHELGIGSLKASVKKAREGVRKRVQESLLLSYERRKDV